MGASAAHQPSPVVLLAPLYYRPSRQACLLALQPMLRCPFLLQAAFGNDPNMGGFGLQVDGRQMEVQARVLPNPRLTYGSPANYDPKG